ncbi:MAG: succinate dehydrogenase, cytochrome b556 subunit [Ignavibacteriales bacterium]|nr:succinate dehydrogenase, cytochrome b556 subunit [Ignavibacteriales bacterium]
MKMKTLQNLKLNFNWGTIAFIMHRISGLALVFYILAHIYSISMVTGGEQSFNDMMASYDTPFGHIIEYLLFLAVLWHLFNGLRITITDLLRFSHQGKRLFVWVFILSGIIAIASLFVFFPELKTLLGGE